MKSANEPVQEYINDPRWKQVTALADRTNFADAASLANKILDDYPKHIREMAFEKESFTLFSNASTDSKAAIND